jgi:hypothetical protein
MRFMRLVISFQCAICLAGSECELRYFENRVLMRFFDYEPYYFNVWDVRSIPPVSTVSSANLLVSSVSANPVSIVVPTAALVNSSSTSEFQA